LDYFNNVVNNFPGSASFNQFSFWGELTL